MFLNENGNGESGDKQKVKVAKGKHSKLMNGEGDDFEW